MLVHPFPPLFGPDSRILILGSFPSVKSREAMFFYGHPQNRFWKVIAAVYGEETPETVGEKRALILRNGLALWDVVRSCEIEGSSDASIRNVTVNDIRVILDNAPIGRVFVNGKTAEKLYRRYTEKLTGRSAEVLPSTSPANAAWSLERLTDAWREALLGGTDAQNR